MTGLNHFTLSHCGSRTPLPTLKPSLTASAPRLSTSCLPSFTGLGVSPNYTTRTAPAHPCTYYTTNESLCLETQGFSYYSVNITYYTYFLHILSTISSIFTPRSSLLHPAREKDPRAAAGNGKTADSPPSGRTARRSLIFQRPAAPAAVPA